MASPLPQVVQNEIVQLYQEGLSTGKIAEQLGVSKRAAWNALKRCGIECRSLREANRRSTTDVSYFDVIDRQDKAYWLGFLYADGCVYYRRPRNNGVVALILQGSDAGHLAKFRDALKSKAPITFRRDWRSARIEIYSTSLTEALTALGCTPHKSKTLRFPVAVPDNLMSHFIRGYFDGDGSLCTKRNNWSWQLTSGSLAFLESVRDVLVRECHVDYAKIQLRNRACYLEYGGNCQIEKILDWLYAGSTSETRLDRKYEKYLQFKQTRNDAKRRYPASPERTAG